MWPMGGAWLSQDLWEHYAFTKDEAYLREQAYPLLKGAAHFCLDWLVEDGNGHLVTAPATSPENCTRFLRPGRDWRSAWPRRWTWPLSGTSSAIPSRLRAFWMWMPTSALHSRSREPGSCPTRSVSMASFRSGPTTGMILMIITDVSHLFGVYPGHQLTPECTPDLVRAAQRSLELRGDGGTGWSMGWKIVLWARFRDGDHSYKMLRTMLTLVTGGETNYMQGGGTLPEPFRCPSAVPDRWQLRCDGWNCRDAAPEPPRFRR